MSVNVSLFLLTTSHPAMYFLVFVLVITTAVPVDNPKPALAAFEKYDEEFDNLSKDGPVDLRMKVRKSFYEDYQTNTHHTVGQLAPARQKNAFGSMMYVNNLQKYPDSSSKLDIFYNPQKRKKSYGSNDKLNNNLRPKREVRDDSFTNSDEDNIEDQDIADALSQNVTGDVLPEIADSLPVESYDNLDRVGNLGTLFDPWAFENEIGLDPTNCFSRLSLTKSVFEDFTKQRGDDSNLNAANLLTVETAYKVEEDKRLSRRQMDDTDDEIISDFSFKQEVAQEMLSSFALPPECHVIKHYGPQGIRLVSACPKSWKNLTIQRLCVSSVPNIVNENTIDLLKLPVQDDKGVVYKNIYCSQCNKAVNVESWEVVQLCEGMSSLFVIDGSIMMFINPELAAPRNCKQTLWPKIPTKVETCRHRKRSSGKQRYTRYSESDNSVTYPVSFSVLMNFGFDGKTHILFSTTHNEKTHVCSEANQVIDANNQCRTMVCPPGYKLVNSKCLREDGPGSLTDSDKQINTIKKLTHLSDTEVITLTVNATYLNLIAFASDDFKRVMVEGIATLFNISSERIHNFTAKLVNSSETRPNVAVQRLTVKPMFQEDEGELGLQSHDVSSGKSLVAASQHGMQTENTMPGKSRVDKPATKTQSSVIATHKVGEDVIPKRGQKKTKLRENETINKPVVVYSFHSHKRKIPLTTPTPTPTPTSTSTLTPFDVLNKPVTLQFSFLLLPPKSSMLNELTVSSIKSKMRRLISTKQFTFTSHGAEFQVLDVEHNNEQNTSGKFCSKGQMKMYDASQLELISAVDTEGQSVAHIMVNSTNSIYGPGKFDLYLMVTGKVGVSANVTDALGYTFVCDMPRIDHKGCVRFQLCENEYTILPNKSIVWNNRLYNMTQYEFVDEALGLIETCVPEDLLHQDQVEVQGCDKGFKTFMLVEAYTTAVLGRISIVVLAIVFLTYCLFERLRNLPGVNTMNLTLALLVSESIFITGESSTQPAWLCSLVGILLHYFFLASFFWMNVMSFDVFRTFGHTSCVLPQVREKSKYLLKYILYSWGSPAVIVGSCIILDFSGIIPGVYIGYGSYSGKGDVSQNISNSSTTQEEIQNYTTRQTVVSLGCWIQNPIASLAAFGAPMVIILIANIFMFTKTILSIRKTAKFTNANTRRSSANKRSGRNDVILYVRMSTVMGFTWVFGHASSVISAFTTPSTVICYTEHVLGVLFVIFNCSQGLFIFFAFVTKRRVFHLYKGLWCRVRNYFKQRQTSTSYTSSSSVSTTASSISTIS